MKKFNFKNFVFCSLVILLSSVIRALSVHIFVTPNNFAPGGVTGIAAMLQYATGVNAGIFIFGFNVPLVILAAIYINKDYAVKSAATTIIVSALLLLLEKVNFYQFDADERILAAIAAGVLGGAALALMLKVNGSTGGSDIVAALIQKKFSSTNVAWFIMLCDAVVVTVSLFVFGSPESVLLSLTELFAAARTTEAITQGLKTALKFEIITDSPEELSGIIFERLNRGVTCIEAKGMYSGKEKYLLICVVRKNQIASFRKLLKEFGRSSFTYISRTSEVVGLGFSNQ